MVFLWNWFRWLFGYNTIEIQGAYGEKFITLCMKNEIELWEIRRVCPGIIHAKLFLFSKKKLDILARKSGVTVEVVEEKGFPVTLQKYRRRTGLFLGIAVYVILLFLLPNFVWSVEIPKANPLQAKEIQSVLLQEGFGVGSFIPGVNYKNLRYQIMLACDEVSFVSVNMEGCRAVVEVHFSESIPQAVDDGTPCNIVASRDGQILSVLIQTGAGYVKKGQTVEKGDLLVGGIMDTRLGYYVVHSKAKILARVTDVESETVTLRQEISERTGRYKVERIWNFFGKEFRITPGFFCPYGEYETEKEMKHLSLGESSPVPVTLTEIYYYETVPREIQISLEEAVSIAKSRLDEADRLRYYNVETESVRDEVAETSNSVTLTRTRSLITDICQDKTFYFED